MLSKKYRFWYSIVALIMVLALLVPVLTACDDDDDDEETTTAAATPTATATATSTAEPTTTEPTPTPTPTTPVSTEPVKIGVLTSWTGPAGMAGLLANQALEVLDYMLEEKGGVLGGRPVEFVTYDNGGDVAKTQAGVKKFAGDSDVMAIVLGGSFAADLNASVILTSELEIPSFTMATWVEMQQYPYSVRVGTVNSGFRAGLCAEYALDNFAPKTVGFLADSTDDGHEAIGFAKGILEGAGVEVVYEQYASYETTDFSTQLTRIKAEDPDVLIHYLANPTSNQSMYKQILGLGGWGDIKVISIGSHPGDLADMAGTQDTYFWGYWFSGLPYDGAKAFEQIWPVVHPGDVPNNIHAMLFSNIWSAVEAIDQAGADRQAIADLIRSGTFGWESPGGPMLIGTDGEPDIKGVIAMVKDGKAIVAP